MIGPQPITRENERNVNKEVAVHEFEEFMEKHGGASKDTEKQYEDPMSKQAQILDNMLHKHNNNDLGYKELDKSDRVIDQRGATTKEALEHFDGYNERRHTYEGVNLAEQSPVRGDVEKWNHDPILHSMEEQVGDGRKRRENVIHHKREEMEGVEVEVSRRELVVPPEDTYFNKADKNVAPDMDLVDPY